MDTTIEVERLVFSIDSEYDSKAAVSHLRRIRFGHYPLRVAVLDRDGVAVVTIHGARIAKDKSALLPPLANTNSGILTVAAFDPDCQKAVLNWFKGLPDE